MTQAYRWSQCISHRGEEAEGFVRAYFSDAGRKVLLIAGAGFDPRATCVCRQLAAVAKDRTHGFFVREERPNPSNDLVTRAEQNLAAMKESLPAHDVVAVDIFAKDGAVVGGRSIARMISALSLEQHTDILIDSSALSIGIVYPIVRYLLEWSKLKQPAANVHMLMSEGPDTDIGISAIPSDRVGTIAGFQGGLALDTNHEAARLWLPQLMIGKSRVLEQIRSHMNPQPQDICPVLPFPACNPRLGDQLIEHYRAEFDRTWEVDGRNIVYADERNPLDLYRTILRIDDGRQRVFAKIGGSICVLSPTGSKALALGMLMAAAERDFPVVYVEAEGYKIDPTKLDQACQRKGELVHVWLYGDVYPK